MAIIIYLNERFKRLFKYIFLGGEKMRKFANIVVRNKKTILIVYVVLIILSLIGAKYTSINYDLSSYLPVGINSIRGRDILDGQFGIKGVAYVMLKDEPFHKVAGIKEQIQAVPGVKEALWLDDAEDILKPESFIDEEIKKQFVSGSSSLIQVFFQDENDSQETLAAVENIEGLLGEKDLIGGPAAVSKEIQEITSKEVVYYSAIAFVVISIILFLSMSSFVEPVLFFATIGVAILLNRGTNFIFKEISSVTYSIASILQLAVSMDYSIFLLHRYMDEKNNFERKEDAMVEAITKTFSSISASALTTISGFLALVIMRYRIGRDIGLVLSKGVFFSLLSVITLLPVLILMSDRLIEKYQHKIFFPSFNRFSSIFIKHRYIALFIAIFLSVPTFLAQSNVEYYYANEKTLPYTSYSNTANREIDKAFSNINRLSIIIPKGDKLKEKSLMNKIGRLDSVESVTGLYSLVDVEIPDFFIPEDAKENFQSKDYSMLAVTLNTPLEDAKTSSIIDSIRSITKSEYDEWYITGEAAIYKDLQEVTSKDFRNVTILSIILIGSIILLTFKSLLIPLILVFIIQLGIWINLSIPYLQGKPLNFISFIIIGAIQLGATVDYAILFTSRYRENLDELPRGEAAIKTVKDTGRSIFTSALILFAGTLSVYLVTSIVSAAELTLLIGRGAIISFILVLVILPAFLMIFDKPIGLTTYNWSKKVDGR